jgi:hypothetical protein
VENSASAGGLPVVSLSALYPLNASEDGPQSIVYAFSREGDLSEELMIDFTVQGSALFAGDYQQRGATSFTATGGSILFARGASVALLLIDPLSDPSSEGDETITLTLSPGEGYTIGANPTGIARIVDNDVAAGSLASVPVAQRFPFHSSFESRNKEFFAALKRDGSVVGWGGSTNWGSTSGVAGLDGDVIQIHANHSAAAALKRDGSVITWGDPDAGGSDSGGLDGGVVQIFSTGKAFAALRSNGSVVTWGQYADTGAVADQLSRDVVTLLDPFLDDRLVPLTQSPLPRISLSVAPAAGVLEDGAPNLIFTFSRSGATALPLTVEYTVGGTATLGRDYTGIAPTPPTRTITFAAGSDTATLTVDPQADPDIEPNETVAIALAAGADYEINSADAVVGTIVSDDLPVISVRFAPVTVSEDGPDPLICTFSRTGPINKALTVFYNLGGTADSRDYSGDLSDRRSIRFERGARAVTARIDPKADEEFEADETITVALKPSSNYSIGNASPPEAVIENDDFPFVSLAVSPDFVAEDGPDKLIYTFTRTGSTGSELTVNYSLQTIGITNPATLADDYTGIPATPDIRTITFAAGSPTATISV